MGFLVMPGAAVLALGAPFGLLQPALLMIELGCNWVLFVAARVAGDRRRRRPWRRRGRAAAAGAGLAPGRSSGAAGRGGSGSRGPVAAPALLWMTTERPALLSPTTGGRHGRARARGARAVARDRRHLRDRAWLAGDGDGALPEAAGGPAGPRGRGTGRRGRRRGRRVVLVRGATALAALSGCGGADLLLTDQDDAGPRPCLALDARDLRETGSVAGWIVGGRPRPRHRLAGGGRPAVDARRPARAARSPDGAGSGRGHPTSGRAGGGRAMNLTGQRRSRRRPPRCGPRSSTPRCCAA